MKNLIIIFSIALIAISCTKDFVVKDIKNASITINAPADNLNTPTNAITFWWEELDGAENYNLQIVKPNFGAVQQLLVDTNITGNKFYYTFSPGTYQWRIKAMNAGGSTVYFTRNIIIDTTSNLSYLTVSVNYPNSGYLTGIKTVQFNWNALNAATYYEIEVKDSQGGVVTNVSNIYSTSFTHTFTNVSDAYYTWRVKAHNSQTTSNYNTANTFTIDVTAPTPSSIIFPSIGALNVNGINDSLKWSRVGGNSLLSTKYDSLVIGTDSTFASYLVAQRVNGTSLKISNIMPPLTAPSPAGNNYYWWRIFSVDSAKNVSAPGPKRNFKLN